MMRNIRAVSYSILLVFLVLFLSALTLTVVSGGEFGGDYFILESLLSMVVGYLGAYMFTEMALGKSRSYGKFLLEDTLSLRKFTLATGVPLVSIFLTAVSTAILLPLLGGDVGVNQTTQELTKYTGTLSIFVSVLYPVIFAPFFEESIFRGLIGKFFGLGRGESTKGTKVAFVLTSSLVFGLLHMQTTGSSFAIVNSVVSPAMGGLVFSTEYLYLKDLRYNMYSHALYNGLIVLVQFILV